MPFYLALPNYSVVAKSSISILPMGKTLDIRMMKQVLTNHSMA